MNLFLMSIIIFIQWWNSGSHEKLEFIFFSAFTIQSVDHLIDQNHPLTELLITHNPQVTFGCKQCASVLIKRCSLIMLQFTYMQSIGCLIIYVGACVHVIGRTDRTKGRNLAIATKQTVRIKLQARPNKKQTLSHVKSTSMSSNVTF